MTTEAQQQSGTRTTYLCPRCRAILGDHFGSGFAGEDAQCPVCGTRFVPDDACNCGKPITAAEWLAGWGFGVSIEDVQGYRERLLDAVSPVGGPGFNELAAPPITGLYQALSAAQGFVHFITYGISHTLLGVLRSLASRRVHVHGIISNAYEKTVHELRAAELGWESDLWMNIATQSASGPHQKLVIVDGLVALAGSANLTDTAWRKVKEDKDMVDVIFEETAVVRFNNLRFSAPWRHFGRRHWFDDGGDEMMMKHLC